MVTTKIFLVVLSLHACTGSFSQSGLDSIPGKLDPRKWSAAIEKKAEKLQQHLIAQSQKALNRFQKQEKHLQKKLAKIDTVKAAAIFGYPAAQYKNLEQGLQNGRQVLDYMPSMDTLLTSLKFLDQNPRLLSASPGAQQQVKEALEKIGTLQKQFENASQIKRFLKERRQYLKEQLSKYNLGRYMKKMNKEVFYYSQTIAEYRDLLSDHKKMESKAIALIREIPAFKKFLQQHSQLSSLFGVSSGGPGSGQVSFTGLQTRASVQQYIQRAVVIGGTNSQQFLTQQLQAANQQISAQKNMSLFPAMQENLGELPDFKPNSHRTKSFFKRLEYGSNVQFGKVNRFLPVTSELAVSVGYKLNDAGVAGIGSSWKLGLGSGIDNIRFSHQGFGIRSFIDWKIKGAIYVSGGYEKNYLPKLNNAVTAVSLPATGSLWQESGLIGVSTKYPMGKKRGTMQVLFDFLSYKNIPRSQPVIFRTGINF